MFLYLKRQQELFKDKGEIMKVYAPINNKTNISLKYISLKERVEQRKSMIRRLKINIEELKKNIKNCEQRIKELESRIKADERLIKKDK